MRFKKKQIKQCQKGFTLVELIITVSILAFGIVGVYTLLFPVITLTNNNSLRLTAVYLAQEGLEIARNIRDNNFLASPTVSWSQGLVDCSLGCQADYKTGTAAQTSANQLTLYSSNNFLKLNVDNFYSYDQGTDTKFKRKITVNQQSGTEILKVVSTVYWDYNGQIYSFETEEYLYNWY